MTKTRKNLLVLLISFLVFLAMTIFYGCDNQGGENCTTLGSGVIVSDTNSEGVTTYTAVPDEWNVFMGWFDGLDKYSDKATIVVDKNTPDGLVAKFETSGTLSINRLLNGAYYRYDEFAQTEASYLNMSYNTTMSVQGELINTQLDIERGSYIGLNGDGFHDYAVVKEGEEVLFSQYYTDDAEKAMLYLDLGDRKVAVEDFVSIGKQLFNVPSASNTVWNLKDLLNSKVYSALEGYIGFRNSVGFIDSVENSKNQTKMTLNVDSLLNELKDKISYLNDPDLQDLKDIVQALTNQYEGIENKLPKIVFEVVVDYDKSSDNEIISAITFNARFEESYSFQFEGEVITIPACTMSCKIENAEIALSNTPNAIPNEIISAFPEAVHAINFHTDATLSFLKENVATLDLNLIDEYKIDLDADINMHFVLDAIDDGKVDLDKIDWKKFGFLSFKISLIENPNDPNQTSRHNGSTEYLNLLIDTEKFGTKAFVYVDLYNPSTSGGLFTSKYILSGAYDIPKLAKLMPQIVEDLVGGDDQEQEELNLKSADLTQKDIIVANLLSNTIKSSYDFETGSLSADEVIFDLMMSLLTKVFPDNQVIQDGLTYSDYGTTLAIEEVKDIIADKFKEADETLSSLGLHNNIFGDKTTHIAIKSGESSYGSIVKNESGEYVNAENKSFAEEYNCAHKMLVGVAEGSTVTGIDDLTYSKDSVASQVSDLQGTLVTIEQGLFSDETTSTTFENCQGNEAKLAMRVYRASFELVDDNTAQITVYLTFSAGTLQSLLVGTFDIPYGLIEYKTTVNLG